MAAKTFSLTVAVTENPAGAPTPQQLLAALAPLLSEPALAAVAPWSATITMASS